MKNNNYLELKKLAKEKNYEEIYNRFGKKKYLEVTPSKYKVEDINQLMTEGNIEEIEKKYNKKTYNVCKKSIKKNKKVSNIKLKYINPNLVEFTKRNVAFALAGFIGLSGLATHAAISDTEKNIQLYEQRYSDTIEEYNVDLEAYAKEINSLNLSTIEIIIKVIYDMWSNIDGYKTPAKYNNVGYLRLSLYKEGIGVCRHMADDFTARMNAINPDYEATNLVVYLNDIESNNNFPRNNLEENIENNNEQFFDRTKITGNHMVSCIKLKEENILLIVDPTNTSIGILEDEKITMFNIYPDGIDMRPIGSIDFGKDVVIDTFDKIIESYSTNKANMEELEKIYGVDNQNAVLEDIKANYDTSMYKVKKIK